MREDTEFERFYAKAPVLAFAMSAAAAGLIYSDAPPIFADIVLPIVLFVSFVANTALSFRIRRSERELQIRCLRVNILLIIGLILAFGQIYRLSGLEVPSDRFDYIYFSFVTFTTVGYGEIVPTGATRLVSIVEAMVGFFTMPLLVAQILNLMNSQDRSETN